MTSPRPPYPLHDVTVRSVLSVTPHMQRITVDGSGLTSLRANLPAQWLKVFIPATDGSLSGGRAYTVRHFDPRTGALAIDFVLHGDNGPLSAWAARAQEGDRLEISEAHPRSGFIIDPTVRHYLLFGDETALPAIGAILEALPDDITAQVFVEVCDVTAEQVMKSSAQISLRWLHRQGADSGLSLLLQAAAEAVHRPDPATAIWVAAESAQVIAIRRLLREREIDKGSVHASGYWKRGEADHKDESLN
ncbi:NADPH-dependent ferric siderophore reductase [Pseudomonas sp. JUb42]|uniref:siderophore-interacting protein n=1 Tax=Pseudomonas sp. JUb42 TaxID=2940611 RepID=UPI002167382E|nr:siderophore-interacting protein [Pseudomonas sp. JUb42]MCS3468612.1 NADPH-dependent ferric siderophore reductase [Pseudomonas sp. JUb42]